MEPKVRSQNTTNGWIYIVLSFQTIRPSLIHVCLPLFNISINVERIGISQEADYEDLETEGQTGIEAYAAFLRREFPRYIRQELDTVLEEELEERLRTRIIDRVQAVQAELFRAFQQSVRVDPPQPSALVGMRAQPVESLVQQPLPVATGEGIAAPLNATSEGRLSNVGLFDRFPFESDGDMGFHLPNPGLPTSGSLELDPGQSTAQPMLPLDLTEVLDGDDGGYSLWMLDT